VIKRTVYPAHMYNTSVGEVAAIARRYRFSVHRKKCAAKVNTKWHETES